jgi:hypothetical protein
LVPLPGAGCGAAVRIEEVGDGAGDESGEDGGGGESEMHFVLGFVGLNGKKSRIEWKS